MTEEEKDYAKSLQWIIFMGDFPLTEAMNCVFHKDWIRECDHEKLFEVPENQLTEVGKIVMRRLLFAKDVLGIELTYEILIQVFRKAKTENRVAEEHEKILKDFQIKEALEKEDYETAQRLAETVENQSITI